MPHDRALDLGEAPPRLFGAIPRARRSLSGERGFALVFFLALLPALLAGAFALGATGLMVTDHRRASNDCRKRLLEGQRQAAVPMQRLLVLNPVARSLRLQAVRLTTALAANAGNPGVTIPLAARLAAVRREQITLDRWQRSLYLAAQTRLRTAQAAAFAGLISRARWLRITPRRFAVARPALRPDGPGPAPEWRKLEGFPKPQALEQKWLWAFQVRGTAARFLNAAYAEEETCAATLNDTKDPWTAELR